MLKKLQAQAGAFRRTFNNARNIGNNKAAQIINADHAQIGVQGSRLGATPQNAPASLLRRAGPQFTPALRGDRTGIAH